MNIMRLPIIPFLIEFSISGPGKTRGFPLSTPLSSGLRRTEEANTCSIFLSSWSRWLHAFDRPLVNSFNMWYNGSMILLGHTLIWRPKPKLIREYEYALSIGTFIPADIIAYLAHLPRVVKHRATRSAKLLYPQPLWNAHKDANCK